MKGAEERARRKSEGNKKKEKLKHVQKESPHGESGRKEGNHKKEGIIAQMGSSLEPSNMDTSGDADCQLHEWKMEDQRCKKQKRGAWTPKPA